MRIGIDARMYHSNFTGIGRYAYELVRNIAAVESTLPEEERNEYVLFFNEPEYDRFEPLSKRFSKVLVNARHYSLREQTFFLSKLKSARLDLMHFTHFNAPIFYRAPCVVTIHDLTLHFFPGKKMNKPWHRAAYHVVLRSIVRRARRIICVSEYTRNDLVELYPETKRKSSVLYLGASETFRSLSKDDISSVRIRFSIEKPFIMYAGNRRGHKNLVNLIKAFAALRTSYGHDILLVITGKEDPAYPEIKAAAYRLGVAEHVRFPGLVSEEDLVGLYNAAEIYVQPSFYEGFGLNILEAFACGTPVACSNRSCLPEIAGDKNVLTFNPDNYRDMANVVHRLLDDNNLMAELANRGKKRAKDFSWRKLAEETLKIYRGCV